MPNPIVQQTIPILFKKILKGGFSGELIIKGQEHTKTLYFINGSLVFARTTDTAERLGEILLQMGKIDEEQKKRIPELTKSQKGKLGKILVQHDIISKLDIFKALSRQINTIAVSLFAITSGSWDFINKTPEVPQDSRFMIKLPGIIKEGMETIGPLSFFENKFYYQAPKTGAIPRSISKHLAEDEIKFYKKLSSFRSMAIEKIVKKLNVSEEYFWRKINLFYLLDILEFDEVSGTLDDTKITIDKNVFEAIEELLGLYEALRSGAVDYYGLLGVSRSASSKDIKDAYTWLVQKYAPEKIKISEEIDQKVMYVLSYLEEAHETLSNEKSKHLYDSQSIEKQAVGDIRGAEDGSGVFDLGEINKVEEPAPSSYEIESIGTPEPIVPAGEIDAQGIPEPPAPVEAVEVEAGREVQEPAGVFDLGEINKVQEPAPSSYEIGMDALKEPVEPPLEIDLEETKEPPAPVEEIGLEAVREVRESAEVLDLGEISKAQAPAPSSYEIEIDAVKEPAQPAYEIELEGIPGPPEPVEEIVPEVNPEPPMPVEEIVPEVSPEPPAPVEEIGLEAVREVQEPAGIFDLGEISKAQAPAPSSYEIEIDAVKEPAQPAYEIEMNAPKEPPVPPDEIELEGIPGPPEPVEEIVPEVSPEPPAPVEEIGLEVAREVQEPGGVFDLGEINKVEEPAPSSYEIETDAPRAPVGPPHQFELEEMPEPHGPAGPPHEIEFEDLKGPEDTAGEIEFDGVKEEEKPVQEIAAQENKEAEDAFGDFGLSGFLDDDEPAKAEEDQEVKEPHQRARELYSKAEELIKQGRHFEAALKLEKVVELDDAIASYYFLLGFTQSQIPLLRAKAEANLLRAAEMEPHNAEPLYALGLLYRAEEVPERAEVFFRKALEVNIDHKLAGKMLNEMEGVEKEEEAPKKKSFFSIFGRKS